MEGIMLSIVTPSFNSEKTIRQTLEGVLKQSYTNYEYIIVDGGSKDGTLDIIREYEPRFQGRLTYTSEPDNGIYDAMNKGVRKAKGKIVGIINSDDYYEEGCFQAVVDAYDAALPYQIIYGEMRTVNEQDEELAVGLISHRNLSQLTLNHPAVFVTKDIYSDKMVYSTDYRYSSDYEFFLCASEDKDITFVPVYRILSNFRTGGASNSNKAAIEANEIQYKHGCISKKKYKLVKMKLKVKSIIM